VAGLGDFFAMEFTATVRPGDFVVVKAVNQLHFEALIF
jgi:hypothetical protein